VSVNRDTAYSVCHYTVRVIGPGSRIGPHEVLGRVGAGGMGEVYRAHDTRLNRTVALKVLPESFALDPDRIARFTREAQILASIGHPNIANIFGVEDAGDVHALVLEFVEGPTLAELIGARTLSSEEWLALAAQIAEALEAAHERGIVHRDLKPANIKVRPDGVVKVLDFGLAKSHDLRATSDAADSPTVMTPAVTGVGVILGTAAYMSPEQARGKPVDKRADIWAFGCVLYEMITGARTFPAETVSDTIAGVLRAEPDWQRLPPETSPAIRRLLARCLEKDPRRRLRDIGEARIAIAGVLEGDAEPGTEPPRRDRRSWRRTLAVASVATLLSATVAGIAAWVWLRPPALVPVRLSIVPPPDAPLSTASVAISPDGQHIVYVSGNGTQLSVRSLADLVPRHLTNLGTPRYPFISPDGQQVGFFDGLNALKVVPITGGPAVTLCTLRGAAGRGASWSGDGTIVFATDDPATGLWRVSERGGTPELLTTPSGEGDQLWPQVLPGGRAALVTLGLRGPEGPRVAVVDLDTRAQRVLLPGTGAQYVPTGHMVYASAGELRAVRFDLPRRDTRGTPVALTALPAGIAGTLAPSDPLGAAVAAVGTLVYVQGHIDDAVRRLVWVERDGREQEIAAPAKGYLIPRVSPDGSTIAVDARDADAADIWIWDVPRQTMTRTTFGVSVYPVWSPDSRQLAHTSFDKLRVGNLHLRAPDGTSQSKRLTDGQTSKYATSFTPDGARLLFREEAGERGLDIGMVTTDERPTVTMLLNSPFNELNPEVAPNGKFLAYESNQSGQNEIYVRPFPDVSGGLWQISTSGGRQPAWSRDGRELFFRAPDGSLVASSVQFEPRFVAGLPVTVLPPGYLASGPYRSYDVSPDGTRFLMIKSAQPETAQRSIVVVQHWGEELKRLLPEN
jgi:serine/threonine protein kinase